MHRTLKRYPGSSALVYAAIGMAGLALNACSIEMGDATGGETNPPPCQPEDPACTYDSSSSSNMGTGGGPGGGASGGGFAQPEPKAADGAGASGLETFPDADMPLGPPDDPKPIPAACDNANKEPHVLYMSADDSNSMGSPGHVRELINIGFEPSPSRIRTYEFLNYYRIAYDAPVYGQLSIVPQMELTKDPLMADFQIGVRSFDAFPARRAMNFTFLVDNSGSMKGLGMDRARAAVHALASKFINGDTVSFITTDSPSAKLDGITISGPNDQALLTVIDTLKTGGVTDLNTSLDAAYALTEKHRDDKRMNRVIFISDGGVDVGTTDIELIAQRSRDGNAEGIYFVGIGTGPALSYNDLLMDTITDAGRGAYVYIDSPAEAQRLLADRFTETMDIAARSVQVELTLPWFFNAEGISTEAPVSANKVEAQHLAPNDAMVFFLKTTACDPSIYERTDPVVIRVFWRTRDAYDPIITTATVPLASLFSGDPFRMAKGRAIVAYAEALKACGFDKQGKYLCKDETERRKVTKEKLIAARILAEETKTMAPGAQDPELQEIIQIINAHTLLQ